MTHDENPEPEPSIETPTTSEPADNYPTPGITPPDSGHSEHGEKPTGVKFPDIEGK